MWQTSVQIYYTEHNVRCHLSIEHVLQQCGVVGGIPFRQENKEYATKNEAFYAGLKVCSILMGQDWHKGFQFRVKMP